MLNWFSRSGQSSTSSINNNLLITAAISFPHYFQVICSRKGGCSSDGLYTAAVAVVVVFVVVVVVLTLTRIIKSVVTGQAPVTLELWYRLPAL